MSKWTYSALKHDTWLAGPRENGLRFGRVGREHVYLASARYLCPQRCRGTDRPPGAPDVCALEHALDQLRLRLVRRRGHAHRAIRFQRPDGTRIGVDRRGLARPGPGERPHERGATFGALLANAPEVGDHVPVKIELCARRRQDLPGLPHRGGHRLAQLVWPVDRLRRLIAHALPVRPGVIARLK